MTGVIKLGSPVDFQFHDVIGHNIAASVKKVAESMGKISLVWTWGLVKVDDSIQRWILLQGFLVFMRKSTCQKKMKENFD